jgi:hypothetical protein
MSDNSKPGSAGEVYWMIEKQIRGRAFWLCEPYSITIPGENKILYSWTHDAFKAMRFGREASAKSFNESETPTLGVVTEHVDMVLPENAPAQQITGDEILSGLKKILKPQYMNDVFTWSQIEKAIHDILNKGENK